MTAVPAPGRWRPLEPDTAAVLLTGLDSWWLSGGRAIDRWLGRATRAHGDTDLSVRADRWAAVAGRLRENGLDGYVAAGGALAPLGVGHDPGGHNLWFAGADRGAWVLQVNLEPGDDATWRYRRDPRVGCPWPATVLDLGGIPTGSPATQLLWKAAHPAGKDDADLRAVLPVLADAERAWLRSAVALAHPTSPWLPLL